jgi:hypothetical protein
MRPEAAANLGGQKANQSGARSGELSGTRCPRGTGDAEPEVEDEQLIQGGVENCDRQRDAQGDGRPADPIEEAEQRVERDSQRRAEHAREPVLERKIERRRRNAERREEGAASERQRDEYGHREQRCP